MSDIPELTELTELPQASQMPAPEVAALTEGLVALDVAVGARGAVGAALDAVRRAAGAPRRAPPRTGPHAPSCSRWPPGSPSTPNTTPPPSASAAGPWTSPGVAPRGPPAVEPLVLAVLAMQEEHLGRPASSLHLAASVLARPDLPGLVTAIFRVRAGRALARMGRGPQALRELRTAAELLADGPTAQDPAWAWWFDRQELDGHHGLARAALGDLDAAAELLHGAARPEAAGPAYRVLFAAELARVLARAGDWRGADTALSALMGAVPSVGSVRALRVMDHAAGGVGRGHRVPPRTRDTARELVRLLRALPGSA